MQPLLGQGALDFEPAPNRSLVSLGWYLRDNIGICDSDYVLCTSDCTQETLEKCATHLTLIFALGLWILLKLTSMTRDPLLGRVVICNWPLYNHIINLLLPPPLNHDRNGYDNGRNTLLNDQTDRYCQPGEEYAIIIHGWKESCETEWVNLLASSKCTSLRDTLAMQLIAPSIVSLPLLQISACTAGVVLFVWTTSGTVDNPIWASSPCSIPCLRY